MDDVLQAFGSTQAMDVIFQTSEEPRYCTSKLWNETMRPYVWDLVSVLNQNYVQFVQAACDKYFERKQGMLLYAQILQLVFEQLRTTLTDIFEPGNDISVNHLSTRDLESAESANGPKDRSLVKQFLIEFTFLQGVSEQELELVRE